MFTYLPLLERILLVFLFVAFIFELLTVIMIHGLWNIADLSLIDKESDDVLERIMDEKTASELKILYGHSGPVYGTSFSPDR